MRIAHVTSVLSRRGAGVSAVVEAVSGQQARMGQDVQVFGLQDADWLNRDEAAWTGAPATALKVSGPTAFGYAAELAPKLRDFCPDIIHLHGLWTYPSWAVSRYSDQPWGCPRLISPHGMLDPWALEQSALKKRVARAGFEGRNLRGAARLHALCAPEEAAIKSAVPGSVIATIPNGVEPRDTKAATYAPPWRDLLPTEAKVLLFLGRLHPKKGLDALIEALARLTAPETKDWHLVIGGWGEQDYVNRLKMRAATLEPAKHGAPRVLFAGPLYDTAKAAAICHAEAFILPSHSEGMPMSVLEAWANGLPTLLTPECNIPEAYEQGAAVAITTDAAHLAHSLAEFFTLPQAMLRDIGARGLALANTQYSWPSVCEAMIQLYEDVRVEANAA